MSEETSKEAATMADIIRSASAWWQLAANALDAGRLEDAARFAHLGHLGTEEMHERIGRIASRP